MKLQNPKHEAFAQRVANGHYAGRAYELSGFRARGQSASASASRLLKKPKVAARIAQLRAEEEARSENLLDRTINALATSGFSNVLDLVEIDAIGVPTLELAGLTRAKAAGIAEVWVEHFNEGRGQFARPVQRAEIKMADKTRALLKLAELLLEPKGGSGRAR